MSTWGMTAATWTDPSKEIDTMPIEEVKARAAGLEALGFYHASASLRSEWAARHGIDPWTEKPVKAPT